MEIYKFSETQTKSMMGSKQCSLGTELINEIMHVRLHSHILEYTAPEKHLGAERWDDGSDSSTVSTRVWISCQVAYARMGTGLYGLNGLSPKVSINMLNVYNIPAIMLGLVILKLTETGYKELASFYQKILQCEWSIYLILLHFPLCTS